MVDVSIYVFIFLALFFEVFLLLTFFEKEARARRKRTPLIQDARVSIIVPCYNEEKTIAKTVESLLALEYPKEKLDIILVNDGSTDGTARALQTYASHPYIRIMYKENAGKYTALNAGIRVAQGDFIACIDADSFVEPDALKEIMQNFDTENVGAVTASMSVYNPHTVLEHMQQAEYLLGITMRYILSTVNGLYVTPGPFSVFRAVVFKKIGLLKAAHDTEDMEIAMRMQKAGWHIQNAPRARVYTTAPKTARALLKQRTRWTTGFLRNSIDYRDLFLNSRFGVLGLLVLPLGIASIFSRIGLFTISTEKTILSVWEWLADTLAVPFFFTFRMPTFDWFFAPVSMMTILLTVTLALLFGLMVMGSTLSRTKTVIGPVVFWYLILYGFFAFLWLTRSVIDVTFGIRRSWR